MAADFRICPACQSRNKLKWEYCVRCGESLLDVAAGLTEEEEAPPADEAPAVDVGRGVPWLPLVVVGAVIVFGVLALRSRPSAEAARPEPALFKIPTLPPSLPAARTVDKS